MGVHERCDRTGDTGDVRRQRVHGGQGDMRDMVMRGLRAQGTCVCAGAGCARGTESHEGHMWHEGCVCSRAVCAQGTHPSSVAVHRVVCWVTEGLHSPPGCPQPP